MDQLFKALEKDFANIKKRIQLNKEKSYQDDREILDLIKEYKRKKSNNESIDNIIMPNSLYAQSLQQKKLDRNGIKIIESYKDEKNIEDTVIWSHDGKNISSSTIDQSIRTKKFLKQNKELLTIKEKSNCRYTVISSKEYKDEIKCPSCGTSIKVSSNITKCPYCNSNFNIQQVKNKISDIYLIYDSKKGLLDSFKSSIKFLIIIDFVTTIVLLILLLIGKSENGLKFTEITVSFIISILIGIGVTVLSMMPITVTKALMNAFKSISSEQKKRNIDKLGKEIREIDEYFSLENFYGIITNRLKIWVFSEVTNNISKNVCKNKNIIDLDILNFEDYQINLQDDKLIVSINCKVRMVCIKKDKLVIEQEKLQLIIGREKNLLTDFSTNLELIACKSCGSSIDLIKDTHCKYCNCEINPYKYDWILLDVK